MPINSKQLQDFIQKMQKSITKFRATHPLTYIITTILIGVLLSFLIEKGLRVYYNRFLGSSFVFSLKRFILVGVVTEVLLITCAYGKEGLDFLYKYRYLFGIGLFVICVGMQINYSSSGTLDSSIQPNFPTQTDDVIGGINRAIRSDEYIVSTPMVMSQYHNNFDPINPDIMASDVLTSLYPKLPNKSPLSLLTNPQYLGFMILPVENAYSFYQLLPWFVAFFAVFEMLMVITKKRKLMSLIGSLVIIFSPVMLWFDNIQNVMYVALLFDMFYLFIHKGRSWKSKICLSLLFGWIAACFVMMIYPAWQVPYGYVLLALLVYLLIENRQKLQWKDLLYILPVIGVVVTLVIPNIIISLDQYKLATQTVYPGQRSESGGGGISQIFYSIASVFFPFVEVPNPCEASGFISLYPIPILLGVYVIIRSVKKKNYDPCLISLVTLSIFFAFIYFIGNNFIAKITLMFLSPIARLRPVLEFVCLLIMIRLLATHQTKSLFKKPWLLAIITAITASVMVYLGTSQINDYAHMAYMHPIMICGAFCLYYILLYCLLDDRKETNYIIGAIAMLFAGYQFLTIHPLKSGLDVYMDKPVAMKIQELSAENQDALWLSSGVTLANYALANDARVINSTNYFPVMDRWHILDPNGEYEDVYNRYAHIGLVLTNNQTSFKLVAPDAFELVLNYDDICLLNPTYLISDKTYANTGLDWAEAPIYAEDGIYIYQLDCHTEEGS